jgi:periplasmic divalent cation tolerance protein
MDSAGEASLILVLSTFPGAESAERAARALVEERLAACANLLPGIRSLYRWEGEIRDDPECLVIFKTSSANRSALERRLVELHPYSVPEVVSLAASAVSPAYLDWALKAIS